MDVSALIIAHIVRACGLGRKPANATEAWMRQNGREPVIRLIVALALIASGVAALALACAARSGSLR